MSYANVILYGAVLPSYENKRCKDKEANNQEVIKVDDPANKKIVKQIFESFD